MTRAAKVYVTRDQFLEIEEAKMRADETKATTDFVNVENLLWRCAVLNGAVAFNPKRLRTEPTELVVI